MGIPDFLLPHSVDVIEPTVTTDGYNDQVLDYDTPASTTTIEHARLQQDSRAERYPNGRQPTDQVWLLFANVDNVITSQSRVVWAERGLTFEVEGEPEPAYDRNSYHHTEATLRIQEG